MQVAGSRYYSPGMGRWVSRDPVGEVGGWNLQAFCANSPTLHVDAIGLEILRVISDATGNPCYIERADLDRLQDYVELSAVPGVVDNGLAASSWLDKVTGHAGANIDQNHRYIYVVGNGWIDLQHVTSSLAVPGAQYGLGFDLGVWFEAKQWIQGLWNPAAAASAFSPEDITSNFLGSMAAFSAASSLYVSEGDAVHNILDLLQPQSRVEAWTLLCKECPPR